MECARRPTDTSLVHRAGADLGRGRGRVSVRVKVGVCTAPD